MSLETREVAVAEGSDSVDEGQLATWWVQVRNTIT
jgi:hypothetical protein